MTSSPYVFKHNPDITAEEHAHILKQLFPGLDRIMDETFFEILDNDGDAIAMAYIEEDSGLVTEVVIFGNDPDHDVRLSPHHLSIILHEVNEAEEEAIRTTLGSMRPENV